MKNKLNYLLIIIVSLFWGTSFVVMSQLNDKMHPLQILAGRWSLAAILALILILIGKVRIDFRKPSVGYLLLTGLTVPSIYAVFEMYGYQYTSASMASIFMAMIPCFALITGVCFFHKRTNKMGAASIFIAFTGLLIATVPGPDFSISEDIKGYLLFIIAVSIAAFYGHFSNIASRDYSAMEITCVMAIMGCITYNSICFICGMGLSTYSIILTDISTFWPVAVLGLGSSFICYLCFNKVLSTMDVALANNINESLTTVIGVTAGIVIDGDSWGLYTFIGLTLMLIGVWMSSRAEEGIKHHPPH